MMLYVFYIWLIGAIITTPAVFIANDNRDTIPVMLIGSIILGLIWPVAFLARALR